MEYARVTDPVQVLYEGQLESVSNLSTVDWVNFFEKAEAAQCFTLAGLAAMPLENLAACISAAPIETFPVVAKMLTDSYDKAAFFAAWMSGAFDDPSSKKMGIWMYDNLLNPSNLTTGKAVVEEAQK